MHVFQILYHQSLPTKYQKLILPSYIIWLLPQYPSRDIKYHKWAKILSKRSLSTRIKRRGTLAWQKRRELFFNLSLISLLVFIKNSAIRLILFSKFHRLFSLQMFFDWQSFWSLFFNHRNLLHFFVCLYFICFLLFFHCNCTCNQTRRHCSVVRFDKIRMLQLCIDDTSRPACTTTTKLNTAVLVFSFRFYFFKPFFLFFF